MIVWTVVEFAVGSLMFSYWLARGAKHDLHLVGDGNPGAVNLWRAAGYKLGLAGVALDFLKGYVPLVFLVEYGILRDYGIVSAALAPVLGHAFSPFLRGRGGKAIAVTFGVWSALTGFEASLAYAVILALLLAAFRAIDKSRFTTAEASGVQVVLGMLLLAAYMYARAFPFPLLWVALGHLLLLTFTHRFALLAFVRSVGLRARRRDEDVLQAADGLPPATLPSDAGKDV